MVLKKIVQIHLRSQAIRNFSFCSVSFRVVVIKSVMDDEGKTLNRIGPLSSIIKNLA